LIEVPLTEKSCDKKSIAEPISVPCSKLNLINVSFWKNNFIYLCLDFACPEGATFNKETLHCKNCTEGTFSLGGGHQYTFNALDNIKSIPPELSLKATSLIDYDDSKCKVQE
jgi:hypothetical protein